MGVPVLVGRDTVPVVARGAAAGRGVEGWHEVRLRVPGHGFGELFALLGSVGGKVTELDGVSAIVLVAHFVR